MNYPRLLISHIREKFFEGKAIILTGARQTGKTTLSEELLSAFPASDVRRFNCDNPSDREWFLDKDLNFLKGLVGDAKIIFIDEAQKVRTIGQTVKLLVDEFKADKQLILTGSSSFNLLDQTQEALTGRKYVYHLFPLSLEEIYPDKNWPEAMKDLEQYLIFGSYPEVVTTVSFNGKRDLLAELSSSYLYKDIFEFQNVRNSDAIRQLLKALALQIGSEVSMQELGQIAGINKNTAERYIDLLEKSFVIFKLSPFFQNKRREIAKQKKIYFYDLGIRNAVINNFNAMSDRNDVGALWENFMVVERMKYRAYHRIAANQYFWRTYDGSEVDLIEESGGRLMGFEFKWQAGRGGKRPQKWLEYPQTSFDVIDRTKMSGFVF